MIHWRRPRLQPGLLPLALATAAALACLSCAAARRPATDALPEPCEAEFIACRNGCPPEDAVCENRCLKRAETCAKRIMASRSASRGCTNEYETCAFDCQNSYSGAPREMNECTGQCDEAYHRCLDSNSRR